jgi:hypothetical protein
VAIRGAVSVSTAQLELGASPPHSESLDLRVARWMRENPHAVPTLVEIARELKAEGETRISMQFVAQIARYKRIIRRAPGEAFAVNNSYTSRLTRIIEATYPDLAGVFETRALADERDGDS